MTQKCNSFTESQIALLYSNPNIKNITPKRIYFTSQFKTQLYKAWIVSRDTSTVEDLLITEGIDPDILGSSRIFSLINGFYRARKKSAPQNEPAPWKGLEARRYLEGTGYFSKGMRAGITMNHTLRAALFKKYPHQSIRDGLVTFGIDPDRVGPSRIREVEKDFQRAIRLGDKEGDWLGGIIPDSHVEILEEHPYFFQFGWWFTASAAFYGDAYPLRFLPVEEVIRIFGADPDDFSDSTRRYIQVHLRGYRTQPKFTYAPRWIPSELELRIHREVTERRLGILDGMIRGTFKRFGDTASARNPLIRQLLCQQLETIPTDPEKVYTKTYILKLVGISRSNYYSILKNDNYGSSIEKREMQDLEDVEAIITTMKYRGFRKGMRQIYMQLPRVTGKHFGLNKIRRLMHKFGLKSGIRVAKLSRIERRKAVQEHVKPNLVKRKFRLHRPGEVALSDVTYLDYNNKDNRAYGSAALDPVTGKLEALDVGERNDLSLVMETLGKVNPSGKNSRIFHTDQGALYLTDKFQNAVVEKGMTQSMSKRGNCQDNAPQESFFGHMKDECPFEEAGDVKHLKSMADEYADYYNNDRPQWGRKKMTPLEYEAYLKGLSQEEMEQHLQEEQERYDTMAETAKQKAIARSRTLGV